MPTLAFQSPQFLALLLLLPLVWRFLTSRRLAVSTALRLGIAALAVLIPAGPRWAMEQTDSDLFILVDRSASCGDAAGRMLREILPLVRKDGYAGDRVAIIGFGEEAIVEQGLGGAAGGFSRSDTFNQASDLAAALRLAGALRSPERRTAFLCLSDGLVTGEEAGLLSADEAAPFWYRQLGTGSGIDVAAGDIVLPESVEPQSAWLVRYEIHAEAPCAADVSLSRAGVHLVRGKVALRRGVNRFFVRDTSGSEAMLEYRLQVALEGDRIPRNNMSSALLTVRGTPRVLLVTGGGKNGLVEQALTAAGIGVDRIAPESFPDAPALLEPYRLVVLENCPVSSFPGRGVATLAQTVEAGMASLLVTGGPNAFGNGGYHRSPLDPLLPVEMELRNEKRRGAMAVAIAMDRSGSMAMTAGGGRSKMDLANLGAAESIRLLSPGDQVAVLAVDTAPHPIVPLSRVDSAEELAQLVLRIQSMGGGIYCRSAIEAAAAEVAKSNLNNRHIILFADASDAEEQEGCIELAESLLARGIRISVIAMGRPADSDAVFLRELALAGDGEILYSGHAGALPALFTQEIMRISRRGFLEEEVTPRLLAGAAALGVRPGSVPPVLSGFNVSAARDGATVYMDLDDEFATPMLAARRLGKSGVGALLFEADGEYSGTFPFWSATPELLVSLARSLAGEVNRAGVKAYSAKRGDGVEAQFEFSPEAARAARRAPINVSWLGPGGVTGQAELVWLDPERAIARLAPPLPGHYLAVADLGELGQAVSPPVGRSYSREFDPRPASEGRAVLAGLAALTGGGEAVDIAMARRSARALRPAGGDLSGMLLWALVALFLLELSGRRLLWFR